MSNAVSIPAKRFLGLLRKGPSSFNVLENAGTKFAADVWAEFINLLVDNGVPLAQDLYGISWPADENTPPQEVFYFCGFESTDQIGAFESLELESGNYFNFDCEVEADNLDKGFQEAYMVAFPASGLTPRDGKHLEIYGQEYDPNSPIARFRILIPVL